MKEIHGLKIEKLRFESRKLGDLIYFEGPLLSLFVDRDNKDMYYLYKWVDNDEIANRWIIIPVEKSILRDFFHKNISLKDVILDAQICYSVNIDNHLIENNILVCLTESLPADYLPGDLSFYEERRYTKFSEEIKEIILNNEVNELLHKIMADVESIKKEQTYIMKVLTEILLKRSKHKNELTANSELLYSNKQKNIQYQN